MHSLLKVPLGQANIVLTTLKCPSIPRQIIDFSNNHVLPERLNGEVTYSDFRLNDTVLDIERVTD